MHTSQEISPLRGSQRATGSRSMHKRAQVQLHSIQEPDIETAYTPTQHSQESANSSTSNTKRVKIRVHLPENDDAFRDLTVENNMFMGIIEI